MTMDRIVAHEVYPPSWFDENRSGTPAGWHWMHPMCSSRFSRMYPGTGYVEIPLSEYTEENYEDITTCDFCKKPIRGQHKEQSND